MTISDRIIATIRTGVPALIGLILARLIADIPAVADWLSFVDTYLTDFTGGIPIATLLSLAATAAVIAGYYWLARTVGARWPWVEKWLLGSSLIPVYGPEVVADNDTGDVSILTRSEYRAYLQARAEDADANR